MVKKITMMQQRSTVDKLQNVGQSLNVGSLETVCLTTVKC